MSRLTLAATLATLMMLAAPAAAEPTPAKTSAAQQRRTQVVRMQPIKAHPMKPNVVVEIRKRRMTLRARGASRFADRIGRRLDRAPF